MSTEENKALVRRFFELLARVHFHILAADQVEGGLVVLVDMGLSTPTSWRERHRARAPGRRQSPRLPPGCSLAPAYPDSSPPIAPLPKILEPC
jgi:hypothetical protein